MFTPSNGFPGTARIAAWTPTILSIVGYQSVTCAKAYDSVPLFAMDLPCSGSVVHWICRAVDLAQYEIWTWNPEADLIDSMADPAADLTQTGLYETNYPKY